MQALTSPGVTVFLQPTIGWRRIDAPPKPVRPSVTGWDALNGEPNRLDPAYPNKKRLFRFPPRSSLGVSCLGMICRKPHALHRLVETSATGLGSRLRAKPTMSHDTPGRSG